MRHTDFIAKNSSFKIIDTCSDDTNVYKFTLADGLTELDSVSAIDIDNGFFTFEIQTPDEDCFIFTKQGNNIGINRVGNPDILVIVCFDEDETISYKQYDMDGAELDSGDMNEIGAGFYYIEPAKLQKSFFNIANGLIVTLKVPYNAGAKKGTISLESNRFEMISIPVKGKTVEEYFLAKVEEVTGKSASESIEFVKAYPSNSVSSGKYLIFIPDVTKSQSASNFKLVEDDNGEDATVPFLVKTKKFEDNIVIEWNTDDGEQVKWVYLLGMFMMLIIMR